MKGYYLFKVSLEKAFKELSRYKFDTLSDILSLYALFMAMFFGLKFFGLSISASSVTLGHTLEGFVAGYFLWAIMMMAYSDVAYSIINDASKGTLEQLSMSDLGLHNILIMRSITNMLVNMLIAFALLVIIMATTGFWLHINIISMLLPIFIGLFSILGLSLIFGGLALIFKKVQSFLNIIQYFLIGLVIPSPGSFNIVLTAALPFRPSINMIYFCMIKGTSFFDFSLGDYGILIANSIVYLAIGLFVFKQCTKIAKRKGLLGQY